MANNRYFMLCRCGGTHYLGKSLGAGIYNTRGGPQSFAMRQHEGAPVLVPEQAPAETHDEGQARFLESVYEWMWEHLIDCVGDEWAKGEIFKVITEYDDRAPGGPIPPYASPGPSAPQETKS